MSTPRTVTGLFAFIATDPANGDEGIVAYEDSTGMMLPMIGADMTRVNALRPIADEIADHTGIPYKIKYFVLENSNGLLH